MYTQSRESISIKRENRFYPYPTLFIISMAVINLLLSFRLTAQCCIYKQCWNSLYFFLSTFELVKIVKIIFMQLSSQMSTRKSNIDKYSTDKSEYRRLCSLCYGIIYRACIRILYSIFFPLLFFFPVFMLLVVVYFLFGMYLNFFSSAKRKETFHTKSYCEFLQHLYLYTNS